MQTVSDAADSLVAHRGSATQNAKAAIGITDALGSIVRDISDESAYSPVRRTQPRQGARVRRVLSQSQLVLRPSGGGVSGYCQSSAGYSLKGIPSLDETFGWQSGAYSGGARVTETAGFQRGRQTRAAKRCRRRSVDSRSCEAAAQAVRCWRPRFPCAARRQATRFRFRSR